MPSCKPVAVAMHNAGDQQPDWQDCKPHSALQDLSHKFMVRDFGRWFVLPPLFVNNASQHTALLLPTASVTTAPLPGS
jgi:hypothetical protein